MDAYWPGIYPPRKFSEFFGDPEENRRDRCKENLFFTRELRWALNRECGPIAEFRRRCCFDWRYKMIQITLQYSQEPFMRLSKSTRLVLSKKTRRRLSYGTGYIESFIGLSKSTRLILRERFKVRMK